MERHLAIHHFQKAYVWKMQMGFHFPGFFQVAYNLNSYPFVVKTRFESKQVKDARNSRVPPTCSLVTLAFSIPQYP